MANKRSYKFGQSQLTLEFGDITKSNAQVLVSSDDNFLSMGGGVSASILRAGGNAIALDAAKKVPAALGDVIVTTAGSLPAQYIFHAITISDESLKADPKAILRQTVNRCLQLLDSLGLNSIAFPAIGAGVAGFSYDDVAEEMADVISEVLKKRRSPVDATLYLFDRFGIMEEMDYINFFEEFAKRVPDVAARTVIEPTAPTVDLSPTTTGGPESEEQLKMRRRNHLRQLIGSLEDTRFGIEARLVEIINSDQIEEIAKLQQQLKENQELRLNFYVELKSLSPEVSIATPEKSSVPMVEETYIDFDLYIASNGHIVASSDQGEATADISPQPPDDIQLALQLIEKRQTNEKLLKNVGQSLYNWLFPSDIHTHLHQTEAVARTKKHKLRLRLRVESPTIASLPLEFLYRESGDYYLATNPDTVLSRYLNLPLPPERVRQREGPLHMLVIMSEPSDLGKFDPESWDALIKEALSKPLADGDMTIHTVMRATRKEIRTALLEKKPDIIQFIGHGVYRYDKGHIALMDDLGDSWLVDERGFANLFQGHDDNLGLISLTACESAESSNPQSFIGIAPQLVERGVPAVVAMQYEVKMKTVKVFIEDFYTSIAAHKPVDWAMQMARNAISLEFNLDNREFATPVLYMRAKDGNVF